MFVQNPTQLWSVRDSAAGAVVASAVKAAGAAGVKHVAKRVGITCAAGATVQPPVQVNLRDGAAGAGTILKSWEVALGLITALSGVNCVNIDEDNLNIIGTAAAAMTLEFAAPPAANTTSAVFLQGFDTGVALTNAGGLG